MRTAVYIFEVVVVVGILAAALRWLWRLLRIRRFRTVCRGVMYRGGQPSLPALWVLAKWFRVRLVINLREDFQENAKLFGMREVRILIPPRTNLPTLEQAQEFLALVAEPANRPLLVHCKVGANRTGFMVALWRVMGQGWEPAAALAEMSERRGGPVPEETRAHFEELLNGLGHGA